MPTAAKQTVMNHCRLIRRVLLLLAAVAILAAYAPADEPKEKPAEKPAENNDKSREGLDGLGFSIDPKQGGKARAKFFGVVGEGYKFVFVIDRSGSMGGEGNKALGAVKAELIECLKNLDTVHQFQIVFYNENPRVFNPSGRPGRLAFANEDNKDRAVRFIGSIKARGGTDHMAALKTAIGLRPDVIFFLTDADEPGLNAKQLEKISYMAGGVMINTIEFGPGPKPSGSSFLAELAKRNAGGYAYVDLSEIGEKKPSEK